MRCQEVNVRYCGKLKVYVQGEGRVGKIGFLTVHDVGSNHRKFVPFVETESMSEVAKKAVFIHVCLPGQDDDDEVLPDDYQFPTLDEIAHDLLSIMDQHHIPSVIGFGEGAGANVLARFGLLYPNRCTGLILIDCTSGSVGFDEKLQSTLINIKEGRSKIFGKIKCLVGKQKRQDKLDTTSRTSTAVNSINMLKYLQSYMKRNDISKWLASDLKCNVVLITGENSKHLETVRTMNSANVNRILLVVLDEVVDTLIESPLELARALILFCKGCGVLIGIPMLGLEKEFNQVKEKKPPTSSQLQLSRRIQIYESMMNEEA